MLLFIKNLQQIPNYLTAINFKLFFILLNNFLKPHQPDFLLFNRLAIIREVANCVKPRFYLIYLLLRIFRLIIKLHIFNISKNQIKPHKLFQILLNFLRIFPLSAR